MNLISRYLDNDQYDTYYKSKLEDSNKKAKYIIYGDYDNFPENLNHISQLENEFKNEIKDYNFGDLISFSQYRDSNTYIIGKNGKLISNPMYNDAGYLSIPFEITQYLTDAYKKYEDIEPSEIYLRHDDNFIKKKIGILDNLWNFQYMFIPIDNTLYVKFSNNIFHNFNLNNIFTSEYLYNFYLNTEKKQTSIKFEIKLKDKKYDEFIDMYGNLFEKPDVHHFYWNERSCGSGCGPKERQSKIKYFGPHENKNEIINILKNFYKGFDYTIEE
jgi:hypothetical protein